VGRPLLLLDVMPGHGRDNLLHELELGGAGVCGATPAAVTAATLALLDDAPPATLPERSPARWEPAFEAACQQIGVDLESHQLAEAISP
jgi:processive 1,2-diacylglycerol beta-glucosyltransferase